MDPRLTKWLGWLDIIKVEVQDLVMAKHMVGEIRSMIGNNPAIRVDNSYYRYLANSYASHAIIGVRRQIKIDSQSVSLARMLLEMSETPEIVSRKYYVSLYKGSTVEDLADGDFNRYADPDAPHIRASMMVEDRQLLADRTAKCEEYADKRIAHRDKREPKAPPTYDEVDSCIDLLDALYVKYFGLFHAGHLDTLLPTWQYDWKAIFRTAWLPRAET